MTKINCLNGPDSFSGGPFPMRATKDSFLPSAFMDTTNFNSELFVMNAGTHMHTTHQFPFLWGYMLKLESQLTRVAVN